MARTIIQQIAFKDVSTAVLYRTYVHAKEHAASIGTAVSITAMTGASFNIYDGYAKGKNLQLVKNKLIVQSWRAGDWRKTEVDSTLILLFEQRGTNGIVTMVHANVPDTEYENLRKGWHEFYWKPWKKYFAQKSVRKAGKE